MDARNLMIGDWVYIDGNIDYVRRNNIYSLLCGDYEKVEPVVLTKDMLELNGWEGSQNKDMYLYMPLWEEYLIEVFPSDGTHVFRYYNKKGPQDSSPELFVDNTIIHFKYVHELQHALRLCGFNELADNFKIK